MRIGVVMMAAAIAAVSGCSSTTIETGGTGGAGEHGDMAGATTTPSANDMQGGAGDMAPASTTCGGATCESWQKCTPSGCALDPASRWDVWTGGSFYLADTGITKPDPYAVCTRSGAELASTNVAQSTDSGSWYIAVLCPDVTADELMQGVVTVSVYDHNTVLADTLMGTIQPFAAKDFSSSTTMLVSTVLTGGTGGSIQLQPKAR